MPTLEHQPLRFEEGRHQQGREQAEPRDLTSRKRPQDRSRSPASIDNDPVVPKRRRPSVDLLEVSSSRSSRQRSSYAEVLLRPELLQDVEVTSTSNTDNPLLEFCLDGGRLKKDDLVDLYGLAGVTKRRRSSLEVTSEERDLPPLLKLCSTYSPAEGFNFKDLGDLRANLARISTNGPVDGGPSDCDTSSPSLLSNLLSQNSNFPPKSSSSERTLANGVDSQGRTALHHLIRGG